MPGIQLNGDGAIEMLAQLNVNSGYTVATVAMRFISLPASGEAVLLGHRSGSQQCYCGVYPSGELFGQFHSTRLNSGVSVSTGTNYEIAIDRLLISDPGYPRARVLLDGTAVATFTSNGAYGSSSGDSRIGLGGLYQAALTPTLSTFSHISIESCVVENNNGIYSQLLTESAGGVGTTRQWWEAPSWAI